MNKGLPEEMSFDLVLPGDILHLIGSDNIWLVARIASDCRIHCVSTVGSSNVIFGPGPCVLDHMHCPDPIIVGG